MVETRIITPEIQQKIMNAIGRVVVRKAVELCPVDMGQLRNSIKFRIEGNEVIIYTEGVEYADKMEYGSPPGVLDQGEKAQLTKWAERHGANPKGVIKFIEKKGIRVGTETSPLHITSFGRDSYRPFLRPAAHQAIPEIRAMIKEALS